MGHKICAIGNTMATCVLCCSLLVLTGACSTSQTSRESTWEVPPGTSSITVNGYPITYEEKGSGPTVILVPGVLTDYRIWKRQVEDLSHRHHVVAISLRHFYLEPWNGRGDDFTVHQHASDLAKIIEAMCPPVDVVGWSYGAHVAFETARTRPYLIRRLVLAEAPIDSLVSQQSAASN